MPKTVSLPDGRTVEIPDDATPDQLAAFKDKLRQKFPAQDITNADEMATRGPAAPGAAPNLPVNDMPESRGVSRLKQHAGIPYVNRSAANVTQNLGRLGEGAGLVESVGIPLVDAPTIGAGLTTAGRTWLAGKTGTAIGTPVGAYLGEKLGGKTGAEIGAGLGGLVGGFAAGIPAVRAENEAALLQQARAKDMMDQDILEGRMLRAKAYNEMQKDFAKRQGGIGQVGSAAQETGYQPPVLKVPAPTTMKRITAEQVPGPDTAGKGNLLTPLAKAGEEGAAQELLRRGRKILYTVPEYDKD